MNTQSFLDNFRHIANAPGGVQRLREMIYYLGVTGAICKQDPSEGDGGALLEDIYEKKQTRIEQGQFKRSARLENLKDTFIESMPDIPKTWVWTRLVEIGEISPKNVAEDDALTSFASMSKISEMHAVPPQPENRLWGTIKKGYTHFADGDVVVAKITPCFENGKAAVIRDLTSGIGAGTTELHVVRPLPGVDSAFIYIFLRSPYFKMIGEGHMTGTAGQKRLPTEYFATRPIPLPPIAEQKRIVAKVDQLMALCDKLEGQQQEREKRFPVLSLASHARFAEAPDQLNLKAIFDDAETVSPEDLRKTILSLAFKGKLVPQNTNDESAAKLLETIAKSLPPIVRHGRKSQTKKTAQPYMIPSNWAWSKFPELGEFGRGKSKHRPRNDSSLYVSGIHPLIQTGNVSRSNGTIKTYTAQYNEKGLAQSKKWPIGTLCITIAANIADSGILGFDACFPDSVVGFIPSEKLPSVRYFEYFMRTAKENLEDFAPATAQKNINLGILEQVLIPIPPAAEQSRIVAKVDQLMALVNQLEEQQNKKLKIAEFFALAAVAAITGTQTKEQETMKSPQTELVTKLQAGSRPKATDKAPLANIVTKHNGELSAKALWQQSGLEIDAFYQQLKTEMANGWIVEPAKAIMKEVEVD